jgi:hypothetical protein
LADIVAATVYGRAYGFERAMDNLGAIAGLLWTVVSPQVAFGCLVVWMSVALAGLLTADPRGPG